jgi:hypothetical protein
VGSYTVTATVAADVNFDGASSAATAFTIQAASLPTVTFTAPASLIYNRTAKTYQASATGPSGLALTYTGRNSTTYNSATAPTNVGDYTVTATTSDTNYTGSRAENFSIAAKGITGTFTASNKGYDGNDSASVTGRSLSGVETGDTVTLEGVTATFNNANVGTGKTVTLTGATLSGAAAGNYSLSSVSTTTADITAAVLSSSAITLTPAEDGSYTASAPGGASFTYSYAGRSANGITTSYSSATAPTAAGYYTVTATATGNYTGSNNTSYFIAGPVAFADTVQKIAAEDSIVIEGSSLLANDRRIDNLGAVQTGGLTLSLATSGANNEAQVDGSDVLFLTTGGSAPWTFTYTIMDAATRTAVGTVTVNNDAVEQPFSLQIVRIGSAAFDGTNTSVTHDFVGVPNQTYLIEYSTDLATWTSAGNQSTGTSGSFAVTISRAGNFASAWNSAMFFRARLVR